MTITPGTPCWWELRADDVVAATAYYARRFRWTYRSKPARAEYCVALDTEGSEIGAIGPKVFGLTQTTAWATFLHSPVLEDSLALTIRHGGRVLTPPVELGELGAFAVISDAVGATVGLWQGLTVPGVQPSLGPGPARIATSALLTPDPSASESFYSHVFDAKPTIVSSPGSRSHWSPLFASAQTATRGGPVGCEGESIRFLAD